MNASDTHVPQSIDELRDIVASAAADQVPLEIVGRGSKRGFGRPVEARAVLAASALRGVDLYEPGELVMSAGAGTPLTEIEAMLAARGQELAFEPADYGAISGGPAGDQTIGGVFACNLAGPRRPKAGAARDHLLGVQCVTGRGEIVKTGGRVVKNVTGYDLCKLLCGSHGTLAVLSRVTFKVMPRAETETTLILRGAGVPELLAGLRQAIASGHEPSGAALLPSLVAGRSGVRAIRLPGAAAAVLRIEGPAPSVAYRCDALARELSTLGMRSERLAAPDSTQLWAEIRDVRLLPARRLLWRFSLPPAAAGDLADWFAELGSEHFYDWGGGLVWLALRRDRAVSPTLLRRAFEGRGGHATFVRADIELRREVPVFEPEPPALAALTRRVKESFDPLRILNRGRMYPEL